ncbi:hypothetical protein LTR16_003691 [Cryomyces antarcticus]|uniref:Histone chaperone domain-containing protein n=1 Tax=Cryomyces antarcticus TaxID=329879 RepID=A0ABR0M6Z7_9PEZI|nr:hypothetical protein LTR16_003691 [Cryomyces antarcticus]
MKDSAELEDDDVVDEDDDVDSAESERSRSFVGRRQISLNGDRENLDDEVTGDARGAGVGVSAMKARKDLGGEGGVVDITEGQGGSVHDSGDYVSKTTRSV